MIRRTCPPADRWAALLGDDLAAGDRDDLQAHLDCCSDCQRALENCAADRALWAAVPGWLRSRSDPPLLAVMERLKQTPEVASDATLDFLEPSDRPGVLGRLNSYDVIEEIGRGGMGIVLKALDPTLHRVVAIKVLAPQLAVSGSARKRFTREARVAAAVCHEHVVTIHAVEEFKSLPYLVMQYVAGQSLQQKLDATGPLPVADILRIGTQAAQGLAAAHAQGLVHRDVKPANILLENGVERVRLSDFGLARTIEDVGVTHSGVIIGTPQYMSPEQARGQPLDARADLFSLGSVLYAMCTGRAPFRGNVALDVLRKVGDESPLPIRRQNAEVPAWLEAIVAKLMAKDADQRFHSAAEVAELLERCLAHVQNPTATPLPAIPGHSERFVTLRRIGPRRRMALALSLLAALFVATEATGYTRVLQALGTILRFKTPEGTLVVEIDDPAIKVTLDEKDLVIQGAGVQEIRLKPGSYTLRATKDGQTKTEIVNVSRDGRATVKVTFEVDIPRAAIPSAVQPGREAPIGQLITRPRFEFATKAAGAEKSGVYSMAMTPDGKRVITSHSDGTTKVWNASNGQIERTFQGRGLFAMSTDGKIVAVGGRDRSINLWQVATGELVRTLRGHGEYVTAMAFSPKGEVLVSGASGSDQKNGELRVWDTVNGKELQRVSTVGKVESLAFAPWSFQRLYVAMGDGQTAAFEFIHGRDQIGREIRRLQHEGTDRVLAVSPIFDIIGVGHGAEGRIAIWYEASLQSRRPKKIDDWLAHDKPITALAFAHQNLMLTASIDGTAKLWDITDETTILATFSPANHGGEIWSAIFTPDEKEIVTAGEDGIVRFWRIEAKFSRPAIPTPMPPADAAPIGQRITRPRFEFGAGSPYGLGIGAAGKTLIVSDLGGTIKIFDMATGRLDGEVKGGSTPFAVSRDGETMAFTKDAKEIVIADAKGNTKHTVPARGQIMALAFSPDGEWLAYSAIEGSGIGEVQIWNIAAKSAKQLDTQDQMRWLAFSADGQRLFATSMSNSVLQFAIDQPTERQPLTLQHRDIVARVAIDPTGRLLAVADGNEGWITLWNQSSTDIVGKKLGSFRALDDRITALAFSPDGKLLVAASRNGSTKLFDVETHRNIAVFAQEERPLAIWSAVFTPDGKEIVTTSQDGIVRFWTIPAGP